MEWSYGLLIVGIIFLVVMVHEFGHYIMARIFGVKVEEFSIGIGLSLISFYRYQEGTKVYSHLHLLPIDKPKNVVSTIYSLRLFPLGGFVRLKGAEPSDQTALDSDSFSVQKPWKRFLIFVGGVLMNLLVGVIVLAIAFTGNFHRSGKYHALDNVVDQYFQVAEVDEFMNPEFMVGDEIFAVNGIALSTISELQTMVDYFQKHDFEVEVYRNGELKTIFTQMYFQDLDLKTSMKYTQMIIVENNIQHGLLISLDFAWLVYRESTKSLIKMIGGSFSKEKIATDTTETLVGPIGFGQQVYGLFMESGWYIVLYVFPLFSFAVAYFNTLPIPLLDGGRMAFALYEMIFRRPVNKKVYEYSLLISMLGLLVLFMYICVKDIINLFV